MTGDEDEGVLAQSLVGRTIKRVRWFDAAPNADWTGHEEGWIWLDDGRVIRFSGYGYDAWGANIEEIEVTDIAACKHCGKPHPDSRVFRQANGLRYAYCSDGNHRSWKEAEPVNEEPE